ncbi:hypothetical protein, partial [Massilia phosphatilytica]
MPGQAPRPPPRRGARPGGGRGRTGSVAVSLMSADDSPTISFTGTASTSNRPACVFQYAWRRRRRAGSGSGAPKCSPRAARRTRRHASSSGLAAGFPRQQHQVLDHPTNSSVLTLSDT